MAIIKTPKEAASAEASLPASSGSKTKERSVNRRIPVIEETLQVQKVEVDRGGYRVVKSIETRDESVDELLRNHRVEIERRPIGLQLKGMDAPPARYEGDTLILPVVEEVLVTEKRLVLVEEVRITRVRGTHRQPQTVSLRKEEISIERLAAQGLPADQSS